LSVSASASREFLITSIGTNPARAASAPAAASSRDIASIFPPLPQSATMTTSCAPSCATRREGSPFAATSRTGALTAGFGLAAGTGAFAAGAVFPAFRAAAEAFAATFFAAAGASSSPAFLLGITTGDVSTSAVPRPMNIIPPPSTSAARTPTRANTLIGPETCAPTLSLSASRPPR
jgi:hypothetical protein